MAHENHADHPGLCHDPNTTEPDSWTDLEVWNSNTDWAGLVSSPQQFFNWSINDSWVEYDDRSSGPLEPTTLNFSALVLAIFPLFTIFGNGLVCLSVYREPVLRTATNFFIVSLATADIMVAVFVMPFAVYVEVSPI